RPRRLKTGEGEVVVEVPQVRDACAPFTSRLFRRAQALPRHRAVAGAGDRRLRARPVGARRRVALAVHDALPLPAQKLKPDATLLWLLSRQRLSSCAYSLITSTSAVRSARPCCRLPQTDRRAAPSTRWRRFARSRVLVRGAAGRRVGRRPGPDA